MYFSHWTSKMMEYDKTTFWADSKLKIMQVEAPCETTSQKTTSLVCAVCVCVCDWFWAPQSRKYHVIPFSLAWIWLKNGTVKCKNSAGVSVPGGVWRLCRCQPGRVSLLCEPAGDVWVWSSRRTPCRTRRRRARAGRGCGDASSWQSYPWTSLCSPGDHKQSSAELTNSVTCVFVHKYKCQASMACLWFLLIRFKSWQVELCVPEMLIIAIGFTLWWQAASWENEPAMPKLHLAACFF